MSDDLFFDDAPDEGSDDAPAVNAYDVLIVDDDPDMVRITEFALARVTVDGAPLRLTCCTSAADARALIEREGRRFAAALVDVCLETDDAGVEFVRWLRETRSEARTRVILRSGQSSLVADRTELASLDLDGFVAKLDLSRARLAATVTDAVRGFLARPSRAPSRRSDAMSSTLTVSRQTLTAAAAESLLDGAEARARELGMAISVAVLDESGVLKAFRRMDGAPLVTVAAAQKKALTAVGFGMATGRAWIEFAKGDPILEAGMHELPDFILLGGGVPVKVDGALVGAIGVSGGHYAHDEECALAALASLGLT